MRRGARAARHQEHRWDAYLEALDAIKERFPMKVCCDDFEVGWCTHGIPCECGGTQAPWPWIIHHHFAWLAHSVRVISSCGASGWTTSGMCRMPPVPSSLHTFSASRMAASALRARKQATAVDARAMCVTTPGRL
jgi:hypothetical protein